jgi:hypothetical protein
MLTGRFVALDDHWSPPVGDLAGPRAVHVDNLGTQPPGLVPHLWHISHVATPVRDAQAAVRLGTATGASSPRQPAVSRWPVLHSQGRSMLQPGWRWHAQRDRSPRSIAPVGVLGKPRRWMGPPPRPLRCHLRLRQHLPTVVATQCQPGVFSNAHQRAQ